MAKPFHLPRPITGAPASLEHDDARGLLRHELSELRSCQLLAEPYLPGHRRPMGVKHRLCQVDPNHCILHLVALLRFVATTPQTWHTAMPPGEGGNHPICHQRSELSLS